jgi:hypothetical protein
MRYPMYPAAAAALATVALALPVQAAHLRHYSHPYPSYAESPAPVEPGMLYGAHRSGPYWQGEPSDHLPIWRYGYYQGNDPDQFIRGQLMRDPRNGAETK